MTSLKIAVYAIAKDETAHVGRFLASARDADAVIIADTGSTDDTVALARAGGALVTCVSISPFRFDDARNAALALVPADIDVCVALDLDEVLLPGWRAHVEAAWASSPTHLTFRFDAGGGIRFTKDKIHARLGYRWRYPCHEALVRSTAAAERVTDVPHVLMGHLPDDVKPRSSYLGMLADAVAVDPLCQRMAFYYARELGYAQQRSAAITAWRRYLALPSARWVVERSFACRSLGDLFKAAGDVREAMRCYRWACDEWPASRDAWVALAWGAYENRDWSLVAEASARALAITERAWVHTEHDTAWGSLADDLASIAAWHLGDSARALAHGTRALSLCPTDERIAANVHFFRHQVPT